MQRTLWSAMAIALAWSAPIAARADDAELAKLREEVRQLKQAYESRIQALERRVQDAEAKAGKAEEAAAQSAQAAQVPAQAGSGMAGASAFNPAVSLILQGTLAGSSRDPETYRISGFVPSGGEVAPPARGLSLAESELIVSASVDPYFRGQLSAALTPDNTIEVEEAYFQTLALGRGFTLKGGRFLSGIGYQNEIHQHAWDFQDASLAYKAFLGGRLNDDGLQLKWVAPTDLFIELGAEIGRGREFPGTDRNRNSVANAGSLFGHIGGDVGASTAWRAGLSYLQASPRDRSYDDVDSTGTGVANSFSGRSRLWVLDGIVKWAPNGDSTHTNFKLQGEYFRRSEEGDLTYDTQAASLGTQTGGFRSRQSGWYLQGVYQFIPQWRAGYRYDQLNAGTTSVGLVDAGSLSAADFPILGRYHARRHTAMLDWSPSEFSRLRLQVARDYARAGEPDNQILLQYVMSLGAHGAHRF
jgi:hypothetical protein